jgi:hypothetical protein
LVNNASVVRAQKFVWEYLSLHPCVDCGEEDIIVLEFDHLPERGKAHGISVMVSNGYGLGAIIAEIDKCEVRCANCHKRKTAIRSEWAKGNTGIEGGPSARL